MPRALVTGGTGFVGSHLIRRLLAAGWEVTATSRRPQDDARHDPVRWVRLSDASDVARIVTEAGPDVVFHLAADQTIRHTADDVDALVRTNVSLGASLLEAVSGAACVVVTARSYSEFWEGRPRPRSLYAATKLAFGAIAEHYREARGVDVRGVVLYDNYGPGDRRSKLVPQLLDAARDRTPITIGPVTQTLDLLYVEDVADGLIAAGGDAEALTTVRSGAPMSIRELLDAVHSVTGVPLEIEIDEQRPTSDQPLRAGDWPVPAGWRPRWSLTAGLRATWDARR